MSAREWKPGDVALAKYEGEQPKRFMYRRVFGADRYRWESETGTTSDDFSASDWFRLLVVIDPEDREAVERLRKSLETHAAWADDPAEGVAVALREFANPTPPKPEEPTGLGAVVEDAEGHKFVRVADPIDGWAHGRQWQRIGGEINAVRNFGWPQIAAVRVLSEGVTA